jgi:hypothetical protein
MDNKLTLSLDSKVIEMAKRYAKKENKSLSRLVEEYFIKITSGKPSKEDISPLVKKLSGVISLPTNFDAKKSYSDHLSKKYGK